MFFRHFDRNPFAFGCLLLTVKCGCRIPILFRPPVFRPFENIDFGTIFAVVFTICFGMFSSYCILIELAFQDINPVMENKKDNGTDHCHYFFFYFNGDLSVLQYHSDCLFVYR